MKIRYLGFVLTAFAFLMAAASQPGARASQRGDAASQSSTAVPQVPPALEEVGGPYRYQELKGTRPFLLMYNDGSSLEWLADRAASMANMGFDGWLMGGLMPNQYSDVWAADGHPETVGEADEKLQAARRANTACRRAGLTHNFLEVNFSGELPDWWDDLGWSKLNDNFRQAARFARAAGFVGICPDTEYVGGQYYYEWPGHSYDHYTRADLRRMAKQRMSEMAAAMYDEWPDMEFFAVHSAEAPLAYSMVAGWVEEAARRQAPGGVHIGTESTYGASNVAYILAHAIDRVRQFEELLSPEAKVYWRATCGSSPGGWPLLLKSDFDGHWSKAANLSVAQFRAMMAGLNMASAKYTWMFSAGPSWWQATREEVKQYQLWENAALPPVPHLEDYYRIASTAEQVADAAMVRASRALRTMSIDNPDALMASIGMRATWMMGQGKGFGRGLRPASDRRYDWTDRQVQRVWDDAELGRSSDVTRIFGFVRDFSVIGPFDNARWGGHERVYPPEQKIDLAATYSGLAGPVRWQQITLPEGQGDIDFTKLFKPKDWTVAYALVYVHSPMEQPAEIRAGSNDSIKVWFNGRLLYDYMIPNGRWAIVDADIIPITLPAGESTVLVKVGETTGQWGLLLRLTDTSGRPLEGITVSATPKRG